MRNTISWKFFTSFLLFCLIGFLFIAFVGTKIIYSHCKEGEITEMYQTTSKISSSYNSPELNAYLKEEGIDNPLLYLQTILPFIEYEAWIINPDGYLVYRSTTGELSSPIHTNFDPTDSDNGYYMVGTFYEQYKTEVVSVFSPLIQDFQTDGYVVLHLPISTIIEEADYQAIVAYQIFAFLLILVFVILLIMSHAICHPLRKIMIAADEYASGNLLYDADITSHDEMGRLSATLAYMAKKLHDATEDQHRFVANVSHDFRSPLTSIKGYIEAMADGTIPEDLFPKYFRIVLDETNRLTKLTQSLLTLNTYDSKSTYLNVETFDIHKTIKQVLATFEGRCIQKRIIFDLIFSSKELYVNADLEKIQQVLYNLVDNAIKFSNPNSNIRIETYVNHDKAYISIKDEGIGIPSDSMNKIWDRFYKSDHSRGKDRTGTGLGLSIVKEIITAHNERIDVISTEGAGTKFIFTIPYASHK